MALRMGSTLSGFYWLSKSNTFFKEKSVIVNGPVYSHLVWKGYKCNNAAQCDRSRDVECQSFTLTSRCLESSSIKLIRLLVYTNNTFWYIFIVSFLSFFLSV